MLYGRWTQLFIKFKFALAGVALLPFVDEKRLLGALSQVYPDLTELESKFVVVEQSLLNS